MSPIAWGGRPITGRRTDAGCRARAVTVSLRVRRMNAAVWRLAGPMILSNLSIPLLGMVDSAVVGHLARPQYLGAVAVGTTLFDALYLSLNFLRMGTTGVTAQVHGAGDNNAVRGVLGQSLMLAAVLALLLLVLQWPLRMAGLALIHPSAEVAGYTRIYFDVRIWSAPAVLADFALLGWFLGLQNARAPLVLLLVVNGTNAVMDGVFVFGLGMNVAGVALASVLAQYLGLGVALWLATRELRRYPGVWRRAELLGAGRFKRLVGVNANIFVRTVSLLFAFGFFTAQSARQGDVILAANALLLNLQQVLSYGLDGLAHAVEALAGRAIGAGDRPGFRLAVRTVIGWSLAIAAVFALIYATLGPALIRLLTDLAHVRVAAVRYLPWMVLSPFISVWPFVFDGVYIGATRVREMRNMMLLAVLGAYLPAWFILQPWGNDGLWAAFMVFLAARGAGLGWLYRRIEAREGFVAAASHGWG